MESQEYVVGYDQMTVFKIGVIIGSTRDGRVCPKVAEYVTNVINSVKWDKSFTLSAIDLGEWNLPLFTDAVIPATIKKSEDYEHEYSRKWSREICRYDAFIFVAPQYNWGYPAVLKNALDYLFNEWANKPAMIVSYGGHGGSKCSTQLKEVLTGLDMKVSENPAEIPFPTRKQIFEGVSDDFNFDDLSGVRESILLSSEQLVRSL